MSTIGKKWSESRRAATDAAEREREDRLQRSERVQAQGACAAIPRLVEEAIRHKKDSVWVMSRVLTERDVAGKNPEELWDRVEYDGLSRGDLAGEALAVYDWCVANDLECFLKRGSDGWLGYAYELHARPRR